jgi:uncharacterized membrane protein (UPF0127 family)
MRHLLLVVLLVAVFLAGCGSKPTTLDDFATRPLTLPGGQVLHVETEISNFELLRGLMYRTSLAPDRGMLFAYPKPDHYQAWMYQTLIPLDIIWMDSSHQIVALDQDVPPCQTQASNCPKYGGKMISAFALQIGGGMARKYGLHTGQTIQW